MWCLLLIKKSKIKLNSIEILNSIICSIVFCFLNFGYFPHWYSFCAHSSLRAQLVPSLVFIVSFQHWVKVNRLYCAHLWRCRAWHYKKKDNVCLWAPISQICVTWPNWMNILTKSHTQGRRVYFPSVQDILESV